MITLIRTLGGVFALSTLATSAMAVLPTVTLDPTLNLQAATTTTPQTTTVAMATPVATAATTFAMPTPTPMPMTLPVPTVATTVAAPVVNGVNPAASQIQRRLLASVVARDANGQEVLVPVTAQTPVQRGMLLEYHGYIINQSPERVRNLKVRFDLPKNTELTSLADMSPSRAMGSIDGVNFQYMPLKTNVGGVLQDLPMSYYKAVRWNIEGLGINEVAEVKYRVWVK